VPGLMLWHDCGWNAEVIMGPRPLPQLRIARECVLACAGLICTILALVPAESTDIFAAERDRMVREQIEKRGIRDPQVLQAMRSTPRHLFVPDDLSRLAYNDRSISIGPTATIPHPHVAALMLELLRVDRSSRVLEIGTGSGYQTALLAQLAARVYTVEIVPELARSSRARLLRLGYANIDFRQGDGYGGWLEHAPFDRIMLTAAPTEIPPVLIEQLAVGGRLVAPVGPRLDLELVVAEKKPDGTLAWSFAGPVVAMPMFHPRS
jgi:protein-L-isoaspartate(D-aspartate) O-methyltransferase